MNTETIAASLLRPSDLVVTDTVGLIEVVYVERTDAETVLVDAVHALTGETYEAVPFGVEALLTVVR